MGLRTWLLLALLLAPGLVQGQGPGPGPGPRPPASWWEVPWWTNRFAQDLNLTETQKGEIGATLRDYRGRMMDLRTAVEKADAEVQTAFNESPVDQRKANDAIERLVASRSDLTRTLSQMSLRLRTILTGEQWQELQRRRPRRFDGERGPAPNVPGNRYPRRPPFVPSPSSDTKQ